MILPDVLEPGLKIIFYGTAVGHKSALEGAYYAGAGKQVQILGQAFGYTALEVGGGIAVTKDEDRARTVINDVDAAFLVFQVGMLAEPGYAAVDQIPDYGRFIEEFV